MVNSTSLLTFAVNLDRKSAYIPVASTVASLTHLFIKYVVIPQLKESDRHWVLDNYFAYVTHSDTPRQIALLFPFAGNIGVYLYDGYCAKEGQKYYDQALKNAEEEDGTAEERFALYMKATEYGHVESLVRVAVPLAVRAPEQAFDLYKRAAYFGHGYALERLGRCYRAGEGTAKREKKAFLAYKASAEAGDSDGMSQLAGCYQIGYGCAQNGALAEEWMIKLRKLS